MLCHHSINFNLLPNTCVRLISWLPCSTYMYLDFHLFQDTAKENIAGKSASDWQKTSYFGVFLGGSVRVLNPIASKSKRLRRGVISGVQLSCTETRFQKWPQSGKNGSKHPMASISMAYDVISCKKSKETLKKSKSLILQCKFGPRSQKWPKIAKKPITQSRFTQFFV